MTQQLYRFYDADDVLLYVGVSNQALRRLIEHHGAKPWFQAIHKVTIRTYDISRAEIERLERLVIKAERPLYNGTHNQGTQAVAACDEALHDAAYYDITELYRKDRTELAAECAVLAEDYQELHAEKVELEHQRDHWRAIAEARAEHIESLRTSLDMLKAMRSGATS